MIYYCHFGSTCKRVQYYDMIFKAGQETAANPSAASSADFENKEVISSSRRQSDASQILCGFFLRRTHTCKPDRAADTRLSGASLPFHDFCCDSENGGRQTDDEAYLGGRLRDISA